MIPIKTKEEIEIMREGGKKLKRVFDEVLPQIKPGATKREIDQKAEKLILKLGGQPSFKMVPKYHWATCITVNEEVVHGIPDDYTFKEGDIVSLDAGVYYRGFHTDRAWTIIIRKTEDGGRKTEDGGRKTEDGGRKTEDGGRKTEDGGRKTENVRYKTKLLQAGRLALEKAIEAARPGNRVGHISLAIQETIEGAGFNVVRVLTGHGVGKKLHEEPQIPCFLKDKLEKTPFLKEGMVLAIEVIYCLGKQDLILLSDNWTTATKDDRISSLFEETIVINGNGAVVLTNGTKRHN